MNHLCTLLGSTVFAGLVAWSAPVQAQGDVARAPGGAPAGRLAQALSGNIEGTVVDERGNPLAGAMVSALGATSALAITDRRGVFVLSALPPGAYLVRAHLSGFAPSRRQFVDVRPSLHERFSLTLARAAGPSARVVRSSVNRPHLLTAGLVPGLDLDPLLLDSRPDGDDSSSASGDHSERAWRLRHLPRSILKEVTAPLAGDGKASADDPAHRRSGAAASGSDALASRSAAALPVTTQVDLLTSGSLDRSAPGGGGSDAGVRGTASFALSGPAWSSGDWSARMSAQSDVGSWSLGGTYRNRALSRYTYDVGFSYSLQHLPSGAVQWPIGGSDPAHRAAGQAYGAGHLALSPRVSFDYVARYAHYDYLGGAGLVSPGVTVTLVPVGGVRIRTQLSQRMLAPGAEEFFEPSSTALWVPLDRTFTAYAGMVAERTRHYQVEIERDVAPGVVVTFATFRQSTSDQQTVAFDAGAVPGDAEPRSYAIGDAGDLSAQGWSVAVSHSLVSRLRGTVEYRVTSANWAQARSADALLLSAGARPADERLRDLRMSIETDLPLTATHVFVTCRVSSGFARRDAELVAPGVDSRFDIQVTQRLPFMDFTSARWQAVVAVKNVFRDAPRDASVYDELLTSRPPTRLVGGVLVRF